MAGIYTPHTKDHRHLLSAAQLTVTSVLASLYSHQKHPGALLLAPEYSGTPTIITIGFHGAENWVNPIAIVLGVVVLVKFTRRSLPPL